MLPTSHLILILAGSLILLLGGLWLVVPALYGVPWVPTREVRIRRALQLAKLQPGEVFYDLGAGDGRVLLIAAKEFGAQAVGIEIGPVQCALGWLRILLSRGRHRARPARARAAGTGEQSRRIRLRCENFYKVDLHNADVIFVYLTSSQTSRLARKLEQELRPGARVVSIAADFLEWQPSQVDRELVIFLYQK